jgi:hypothetical protein
MPLELIQGTDFLNTGRIKLNHVYSSQTYVWSSSTAPYSIISMDLPFSGGSTNRATGAYSSVLGGQYNHASSGFGASISSTVAGGRYNEASYYSFVGAGRNGNASFDSAVAAGFLNIAYMGSFVGAGLTNEARYYSAVGAGTGNKAIDGFGSCFIGAGNGNKAYGSYSFVGAGFLNRSYGLRSSVVGGASNYVKTSAARGFIGGGRYNYVSSIDATIGGGFYNSVTGAYGAVLGGKGNHAKYGWSAAFGGGSETRANYDIVLGATNTTTPSTANNTIRLEGALGNVKIDGTVSSPESDYAEYFEWEDKNVNSEDRKGLFVSLSKDKIKISDEYVIGIVSVQPSVIGDSAPNSWSKKYIKDIWGQNIYEEYSIYNAKDEEYKKPIYVDKDGNKFKETPNPSHKDGIKYDGEISESPTGIKKFPKMNPDFDNSLNYTPREERPEWAPVGLLGKLLVRTAEQITGDFVDANSDGMAVNGTKYRVLKTVKEYESPYGIVQVLLK